MLENNVYVCLASYEDIKNIEFDQFNFIDENLTNIKTLKDLPTKYFEEEILEQEVNDIKELKFSIFINFENGTEKPFISLDYDDYSNDMNLAFEDGVEEIDLESFLIIYKKASEKSNDFER